MELLEPTLEKQLKGHLNEITTLFYSPNERQIASGSLDNSVLLWDLVGTMRSYRFRGHSEAVMDVTFSPSGKHMASASRDNTVRLWVPTVTGSTGVFKAHSQTVRSVQFSSDASKILTASDDKVVKLWSCEKFKFISSFVGHTNWVRCARMSHDGSVIASCSDDKTTRLWNPETGENIHTYKEQKSHGLNLAWHPSGCYVAVGTSLGNVKLYDVRTHTLVQYYSVHSDAVTQVAFHPSGSYIITVSKDGKMKILDLLEGRPLFTLSAHTGAVNAVSFSPSGESFASAGEDKMVNIWKTNFTELCSDAKENEDLAQKPSTVPKAQKKQGPRHWYLCYHSARIPVTTFIHLDDTENRSPRQSDIPSFDQQPNANSTLIEPSQDMYVSRTQSIPRNTPLNMSTPTAFSQRTESRISHSTPRNVSDNPDYTFSVGHTSHIPRTYPPKPSTYTIPSVVNKSLASDHSDNEDLFGMVKLKQNDVCYTSGTIEWVGRKRTFPLNSGFKILNDNLNRETNGPLQKRLKKSGLDQFRECECADMLPTVNAIVDHLNALHEAVDLVDLRLGNLEDTANKSV